MGTTEVSTSWWMDKENMVHIYTGIPLSQKKRSWTPVVCDNVDGSGGHYVNWSNPDAQGQGLRDVTPMQNLSKLVSGGLRSSGALWHLRGLKITVMFSIFFKAGRKDFEWSVFEETDNVQLPWLEHYTCIHVSRHHMVSLKFGIFTVFMCQLKRKSELHVWQSLCAFHSLYLLVTKFLFLLSVYI